MSDGLTLGMGVGEVNESGEYAYHIEDDEGKRIDSPLSRLSNIDANNARPLDGPNLDIVEESPLLVERFLRTTGTALDSKGQSVVKTFRRLATIQVLKTKEGVPGVETRASQAFNFTEGAEHPDSVRLWTIIPETPFDSDEAIEQYLASGSVSFKIVPLGQTGAQYPRDKKGNVKGIDSVKADSTFSIPRAAYKNIILVDRKVDENGVSVPTRVRISYYMRLRVRDTDKQVKKEGFANPVNPSLFISVWDRSMLDVTRDFLSVYETVAEGKSMDEAVHAALSVLFKGGEYASTEAHRGLELIARIAVANTVGLLPMDTRRKYQLDDRMRLYAVTLRDCYYGVENTNSTYTDFHGRLVRLEDPLALSARNIQGKTRINNNADIVMFS